MTSTTVYVSPEADRIAEQSLRNFGRLSDYRAKQARMVREEIELEKSQLTDYVMAHWPHLPVITLAQTLGAAHARMSEDSDFGLAAAQGWAAEQLGQPMQAA